MDDALIAIWIGRARIAFGAVAIVAPRLVSRTLATGGSADGIEPLLARMAGARDIALGLGTVLAIDKGAPVRGWLEGSALADAGDTMAALLSRERLRPVAFAGTVAASASSAIACGLLARRLDPAPPAHPRQPEAVVTGHPE